MYVVCTPKRQRRRRKSGIRTRTRRRRRRWSKRRIRNEIFVRKNSNQVQWFFFLFASLSCYLFFSLSLYLARSLFSVFIYRFIFSIRVCISVQSESFFLNVNIHVLTKRWNEDRKRGREGEKLIIRKSRIEPKLKKTAIETIDRSSKQNAKRQNTRQSERREKACTNKTKIKMKTIERDRNGIQLKKCTGKKTIFLEWMKRANKREREMPCEQEKSLAKKKIRKKSDNDDVEAPKGFTYRWCVFNQKRKKIV